MKLRRDQHGAHRAPASRTGSRQAGQSGGSPTSSRGRNVAPAIALSLPSQRRGAMVVVDSIGFKLLPLAAELNPQKAAMPGPAVFDRQLLRVRQRRAGALGAATFLIDRVAADLADRLTVVTRSFPLAVDLGTPNAAVRHALAASPAIGTMIAVAPIVSGRGQPIDLQVVADEEALPFRDGSLDLVVSALALQFVNDLPGTLAQVRRALKPDGLFLAALVGGDTLSELRQSFAAAEADLEGGISPRVAPFADLRDMGALLQRAGFALPVTDVERITVRYASAFALMHDLRRMGATNALIERRRRVLRRATLMRMAEIYATRFADADGRVRATFEIVWLSGWPPHESQQKPLAPGTAQRRLADALGAREIPAGDKAEP